MITTQRPRRHLTALALALGWVLATWILAPVSITEAQEPPAHHESESHHKSKAHQGYHHDFSDAEHWSERFDSPERQEWQKPEEIVRLMEIEPGMTVADLGAGTGYFLSYLSEATGASGRVLALDVEEGLVHFMTERARREAWGNVEARRISPDDPGLEAGSVDRILIVNTWHHIDDRGAYSAKLRHALKPGGRVYVVDLTKESPTGPPPEHRLSAQRILGELGQGGLEAEILSETLPHQFIVVGRPTPR